MLRNAAGWEGPAGYTANYLTVQSRDFRVTASGTSCQWHRDYGLGGWNGPCPAARVPIQLRESQPRFAWDYMPRGILKLEVNCLIVHRSDCTPT